MQVIPPPPAYVKASAVPPPPPYVTIAPVPPPPRVRRVCDTECYVDYWLVSFRDYDNPANVAEFDTWPGKPLDIAGLRDYLARSTIVTFNGKNYDEPMIAAALAGYDCGQLKWLNDQIILQRLRPWDLEKRFNIYVPDYIDGIDLIEVMPGQHGLKMYMAKMHSRQIQELPIQPEANISPADRDTIRRYCRNDLTGNIDALRTFEKEIALREKMSAEYGVDLRSKSDAQIAEAVIKSELGFRIERPVWATGSYFHYDPPAFLIYQTDQLRALLEKVRTARFVLGDKSVEMPPELDSAEIRIGSSVYRLGIGGLHSSESSIFHYSDTATSLQDIDGVSFYPRMMLNSKMYPPQMGELFLKVFESIVDRRVAAKEAGDKSTADSLKITINGTFGKTLSMYGYLSAPKMGIQTTVTGQLSLLMLIEMMELCSIPVMSANTDGIVVKCPHALAWLRDQIIADWELRTGIATEAVDYEAILSRDVNNYIAIKKKDRSVKLKGAFAPPVPVGSSWPNPTGEICVDAIVQYLLHRTPLEATIRACTDIRKFVYVRNVKGGGVKYYGHEIDHASTKGGMRAQLAQAGWVETSKEIFEHSGVGLVGSLSMKEAHRHAVRELRERNPIKKEYLGKVVRWYYASGQVGAIHYLSNGNLVPRTEGAKPLMILPDVLPADMDFAWYVNEAKSMLADVGVAYVE